MLSVTRNKINIPLFSASCLLFKTSVTCGTWVRYINFNAGKWKWTPTSHPTLHTPFKNIPRLTNSFFSRCLVNYSHRLNNWEAHQFESFTSAAAAFIRTGGYSDARCWLNQRWMLPSRIRSVLQFGNVYSTISLVLCPLCKFWIDQFMIWECWGPQMTTIFIVIVEIRVCCAPYHLCG